MFDNIEKNINSGQENGKKEENRAINSEETLLNVGYIFKSFQPICMVLGVQKISFIGNNYIPMTTRAKIYPFIYLCLLILIYLCSFVQRLQYGENLEESLYWGSHINFVISLLILASSIFSSVFKNSHDNFKLALNIKYFDDKLKVPSAWYVKIRRRVKTIYFFYIILHAYVALLDILAWKSFNILHVYVIYIAFLSEVMIIFQYIFDIWIVVNRLKMLSCQLVDLVQPILRHGDGDVVINMDYLHRDFSVDTSPNIRRKTIIVRENFNSGMIRLMSVYDRLADNIALINSTYGIQVRKYVQIF